MRSLDKHKRWIFAAILVILSLLGTFVLWRSTPYGLGLVNDSATYVEGATRIFEGKGYVRVSGGGEIKPITHFPPLFSLLLAGTGLLGMDLLQAGRVLVTILFGVDILLVGLTVYKISHSTVFACLGATLLAVSDLHLGVYSFALSEPLFITLMLAAFLCLGISFKHPGWVWLVASGILFSLATLTRFAGMGLILAAIIAIILLDPPHALKRAGIMLAGALPLILAWQVYAVAISSAGSLGNRLLLYHPLPVKTLFEALKNLLTWIAPDDLLSASPVFGWVLSLFSILTLPALVLWLAWVTWHRIGMTRQHLKPGVELATAFTLGLHILVYLGFLVISLTFFDASTPLDDRILSVVYLPEIILFSSALSWLWRWLGERRRIFRWVLAGLILLLVAFTAKDGYAAVRQLEREGQGFAHRGISGSPAIQAIRDMPPTIIYSNRPGAIFLLAGRSAYVTPTPLDPVTGQARSNYLDDLGVMQQRVRDGQAMLVLFGLRGSPDPDEAELFDSLSDSLAVQGDYGDIVIFGRSH